MITKFFIGIIRHQRDAFRNFFRNFMLSLSALASINVTLIVVSAAVLMGLNFNEFTKSVANDVTIIARINTDVTKEEISIMQKEIENNDAVKSVTYRTKEQELERIIQEKGRISEAAKNLGEENPLNDVFHIEIADANKIDTLIKDLDDTGNFLSVIYARDVIDKMLKLFNYAKIIAYIIIASLLLVTVFIIYNTIRITIYTRSTQIEIMRLIGASNYHISMPYIYEGILIGIFGSLLPVALTIYGYQYFYDNYNTGFIKSFFTLVSPEPYVYYISAAMIIGGIVVGVVGSGLSVRRFLKR